MHLFLDKNLAENYQSPSQVARVLAKPLPSKKVGCWQLCNVLKSCLIPILPSKIFMPTRQYLPNNFQAISIFMLKFANNYKF